MSKGWIGFDLDGTLAEYHGWKHDGSVGAPIPKMVERVKKYIAAGWMVKIFTARASTWDRDKQIPIIQAWCKEHIGTVLPITCTKDMSMVLLYDDRAIAAEENTGEILGYREERFNG